MESATTAPQSESHEWDDYDELIIDEEIQNSYHSGNVSRYMNRGAAFGYPSARTDSQLRLQRLKNMRIRKLVLAGILFAGLLLIGMGAFVVVKLNDRPKKVDPFEFVDMNKISEVSSLTLQCRKQLNSSIAYHELQYPESCSVTTCYVPRYDRVLMLTTHKIKVLPATVCKKDHRCDDKERCEYSNKPYKSVSGGWSILTGEEQVKMLAQVVPDGKKIDRYDNLVNNYNCSHLRQYHEKYCKDGVEVLVRANIKSCSSPLPQNGGKYCQGNTWYWQICGRCTIKSDYDPFQKAVEFCNRRGTINVRRISGCEYSCHNQFKLELAQGVRCKSGKEEHWYCVGDPGSARCIDMSLAFDEFEKWRERVKLEMMQKRKLATGQSNIVSNIFAYEYESMDETALFD